MYEECEYSYGNVITFMANPIAHDDFLNQTYRCPTAEGDLRLGSAPLWGKGVPSAVEGDLRPKGVPSAVEGDLRSKGPFRALRSEGN
jgi:hypothetical protein